MNNENEELSKEDIEQIKRNRRIREVFFLNIFAFATLFIFVVNIMFNHKKIAYSAYNNRTVLDNTAVWRGQIKARDGEVLAITEEDGERFYPQQETFAHTVGYYDYGRVGLENSYGIEMESINLELYSYFINIFGANLKGNDVITTIDLGMQSFIYEKVKNCKSAVIVLDVETGEILSMVSTPAFNPNNINEIWDDISVDEENTPLINRSIQGQYPPGSTFKVVTALSFIRNDENYENYIYNCTGSISIDGTTIDCYNNEAHGEVDLQRALEVSCNTYFASLSNKITHKQLEKTANDLLFNKSLDFILPYKNSSFGFKSTDDMGDYLRTYIGQGDTLVTPLYLAQIFQAIANDGVMLEPHLVKQIESSKGRAVDYIEPKKIKKVMSQEESELLTTYLKTVTKDGGTASTLKNLPFEVAGKTGSAENPHGADHGWFVGFTPANEPKVVVAMIYENNGGSSKMMEDVSEIFSYIMK